MTGVILQDRNFSQSGAGEYFQFDQSELRYILKMFWKKQTSQCVTAFGKYSIPEEFEPGSDSLTPKSRSYRKENPFWVFSDFSWNKLFLVTMPEVHQMVSIERIFAVGNASMFH